MGSQKHQVQEFSFQLSVNGNNEMVLKYRNDSIKVEEQKARENHDSLKLHNTTLTPKIFH